MKKIGTITFHSSYNFGSNLQAYALQEYIKKICKENNEEVQYEIINLRKQIQKDMYNYRKSNRGIKKILTALLCGNKFNKREKLFEEFINKELQLTKKEYSTYEELEKEDFDYDYYISGSDQIWNFKATDFDWAYFLEFVNKGKKISYAASFGSQERETTPEIEEKIKKLINSYEKISVREKASLEKAQKYTNKPMEINIDPTMLLEKKQWEELIEKEPVYKNNEYLLFYTLKINNERVKFIKEIAKKLNLKVIVMKPYLTYDIKGGFVRKYDTGPKEFLNLIKNAKLIISSSFHGTVFSIIMNKPFYSLDGLKDDRIKTFLKDIHLENREITIDKNIEELKDIYNVDFSDANKFIAEEREKSKKFLVSALEL